MELYYDLTFLFKQIDTTFKYYDYLRDTAFYSVKGMDIKGASSAVDFLGVHNLIKNSFNFESTKILQPTLLIYSKDVDTHHPHTESKVGRQTKWM